MTREEYLRNLNALRSNGTKNPTIDDLALVCPHLTRQELEALLSRKDHLYIACPALRVQASFQIVCLDPRHMSGNTVYPSMLRWAYSGRAEKKEQGYLHIGRALEFAQQHWGSDLVPDTWKNFLEIYLQDPSDLYDDGYGRRFPRTKYTIAMATDPSRSEIIDQDSTPESVRLNESIVEITLDPVIAHELKGPRGGGEQFSCAHCSAGLGLGGCTGCEHRFSDSEARSGWYTPLPAKAIAVVRANSWVFRKDPAIAVASERKRWQQRR